MLNIHIYIRKIKVNLILYSRKISARNLICIINFLLCDRLILILYEYSSICYSCSIHNEYYNSLWISFTFCRVFFCFYLYFYTASISFKTSDHYTSWIIRQTTSLGDPFHNSRGVIAIILNYISLSLVVFIYFFSFTVDERKVNVLI